MPSFLKRKVGPFPVGVWLLIGAAGIGVAYYIKKRRAASQVAGLAPTQDLTGGADLGAAASEPFGVPVSGAAGGGGFAGGGGGFTDSFLVPATPPPEPSLPVIPPPAPVEPVTGGTGPLPSSSPQPAGGFPCPPGYYWNGHTCLQNAPGIINPRQEPGATPAAGPGQPRRCPTGFHWNGFACVPNAAIRSLY